MEEIFKEMGVAIDDFFAEADEFIENYKENHSFDAIPFSASAGEVTVTEPPVKLPMNSPFNKIGAA